MTKNLSDTVVSKQTAKNRFISFVSPMTKGFFRDTYWLALSQTLSAVRSVGGEIEIQSSKYFWSGENPCAGKTWFVTVTACGHSFDAIFTATFADKPNGEVYDFNVTL